MAEYYLISQLPSLDAVGENSPLPITEERFLELCTNFLGKKALEEIKKLTLLPPKDREKSSSTLINSWNDGERALRLALARLRAEKMKKSFDYEKTSEQSELIKTVKTAVEMDSPLEAEKLLNLYRLQFLEALRPMDNFSEDYLYYYGLKLKLLLYIKQFNKDAGEKAYKTIYNSILSGDGLEDIQ
jgi:hypothetical protein